MWIMWFLNRFKLFTDVVSGGSVSGRTSHLTSGTRGLGRGNVPTHNFINIIAYNQNIQSYTTVTMSNIIALMYIIIWNHIKQSRVYIFVPKSKKC